MSSRLSLLAAPLLLVACAPGLGAPALAGFAPSGASGEQVLVLDLHPGITATIVAPRDIDLRGRVELILYALPNGNSTAETIGRTSGEGVGWRYDIQHIGAQTRAFRARGSPQAIVAYLEADTKSWPEWRRIQGVAAANVRIVGVVDQIRAAIGSPSRLSVTLTGHSGGGSFTWGFLDGQAALPDWLDRVAFLDSNYSFEQRHGTKLVEWLRRDVAHRLVVLAYDDREIMLDGKRVVSDSGGTWRASHRMIAQLSATESFAEDEFGPFRRYRSSQVEVLLHPNPDNRILHTELIGEMNGYLHALLSGRAAYERGEPVLRPGRVYGQWVAGAVALPPPTPPAIPARDRHAPTGSAFIASVAALSPADREAAVLRELMAGNIPGFLRGLRPVEVSATGADGSRHTIHYEVMPDYLAIGSDDDFVRMPMGPYTAQAFCDAFGFVLPTGKMVGDIWSSASIQLEPRPLTEARESASTFLQHHRIVESQLAEAGRGSLVAGAKKDVVVSNRLLERPGRVAIFGWHRPDGRPIQPMYAGHVDWYVDYSHGIRPVRRSMRVDGLVRRFEEILADPELLALLSDEGRLAVTRYGR